MSDPKHVTPFVAQRITLFYDRTPSAVPDGWDEDVWRAVELGRITRRRADAIHAARRRKQNPCTQCGTPTQPADGDWITCPNGGDVCIDCCPCC